MTLQPCRAALPRAGVRSCARALQQPCLRTFATKSTSTDKPAAAAPAADDTFKDAFANVRRTDDYTDARVVPREAPSGKTPRWSQTPHGMQAGLRMDFAKKQHNKFWKINSDPQKLDAMYERLLGPGGSTLLPEELKWLAVTHKSFDQARRGFNDRLAMMGRSILMLEATKNILSKGTVHDLSKLPDAHREYRKPFENKQLAATDNLLFEGATKVVNKDSLQALANGVGLLEVMRWKPRLVSALQSSGVDVVLSGGILAIIGALNLQHGSEVASRLVQDRFLGKMVKGN